MGITKRVKEKWFQIIICILILITIRVINSEHLQKTDSDVNNQITIKQIQNIFPEAANFQISENQKSWLEIYNNKQEVIAWYVFTKNVDINNIGFGGPVNFIIGLNINKKIENVSLCAHNETPSFIEKLKSDNFFNTWNGLTIDKAIHINVDTISGATMTSSAIINGLQERLKIAGKNNNQNYNFKINSYYKRILVLLVYCFSIISFLNPKRLLRFRLLLLIINVIILGFVYGHFISIALINNWIMNGVPWISYPLLVLLIFVSIFLSIVSNKSFYCMYLCPYGSFQELTGKIIKKNFKLPNKLQNKLKHLRKIVLGLITITLLLGVSIDLTNFEPFTAFMFNFAAIVVMISAIFFLLLSIISPRFWCKYLCPTGEFLKIFQTKF